MINPATSWFEIVELLTLQQELDIRLRSETGVYAWYILYTWHIPAQSLAFICIFWPVSLWYTSYTMHIPANVPSAKNSYLHLHSAVCGDVWIYGFVCPGYARFLGVDTAKLNWKGLCIYPAYTRGHWDGICWHMPGICGHIWLLLNEVFFKIGTSILIY